MKSFQPPFEPPFPARIPPFFSLVLALGAVLAGCGTTQPVTRGEPVSKEAVSKSTQPAPPYTGGGYYQDDGPGLNPPANLAEIPDAIPKAEALHKYANNPYKVLGKTYVPLNGNTGYREDGLASWYGRKFHGKATSSGEPYDMYAMSAAHPTLPIPSYVRVTNTGNGKSVVVRINDRGPFHEGRLIDLSYTAAYKLGVLKGVTPVSVEAVQAGDAAPTSFAAQSVEPTLAVNVAPATPAKAAVVSLSEGVAAPITSLSPEPAPASASASAKAAQIGQSLYLQLGAFSTQVRANELLEKVSARLSRTFPGVLRLVEEGMFKVQAGPFASVLEAEKVASMLRDELGLKPFKVFGKPHSLNEEGRGDAPKAATLGAPIYLQVAALSSPQTAQRLMHDLRSRYGDELAPVSQILQGDVIKVRLGPFASAEAADRLSLAYQHDFGVRPCVLLR